MWRCQLASGPQAIYAKRDLSLCRMFAGPQSCLSPRDWQSPADDMYYHFLFRSEMYNVHLLENKTTVTGPAADTAIIYKITVAWIGVTTGCVLWPLLLTWCWGCWGVLMCQANNSQCLMKGLLYRPSNTNSVIFNMALQHLAFLSTDVISSMWDKYRIVFLEEKCTQAESHQYWGFVLHYLSQDQYGSDHANVNGIRILLNEGSQLWTK